MPPKVIYSALAFAGIALASGAAWWMQQPRSGGSAPASVGQQATPPQAAASAAAAGKPPSVEVGKVELVRMTDDTQAVGSLRSRRGVILRPEVSGRISQLNFTDGQRVRKGQLLVQFDDQLPLAQLQQSQAELSIAEANQKRNQELVAQNFISRRSLDESAASLQVAQAKLSLARATAERLKIFAPFDGIVGIRLVNVGDYLKDGADIVNIEDIEAIYVDFRLPERFQSKLRRGQLAELDIDALPGRKYTAQVQAIDPLIDANGRSVGVRACMDNRELQLRPGMFARVNTVFGVRENARVIPEEAILPQGGRQFVIKLMDGPDGLTKTSKRVEVKVGLRTPGKVEIVEGLAAGDTVVTTGQQRLQRDGTVVAVVDLKEAAPGRPAAQGAVAPGERPSSAVRSPAAGDAAPPVSTAAGQAASKAPDGKLTRVAAPGPNPCGPLVQDTGSSTGRTTGSGAQGPRPVVPPRRGPA